TEAINELEQLRESLKTQLKELDESYEQAMQSCFDHFQEHLQSSDKTITSATENRYQFLQAELEQLKHRCDQQVGHLKVKMLQHLTREITVAQGQVSKLQTEALEEGVLPRLRQHREELGLITREFQNKLGADLEKKAAIEVSKFEPLIEDKRRKIMAMRE